MMRDLSNTDYVESLVNSIDRDLVNFEALIFSDDADSDEEDQNAIDEQLDLMDIEQQVDELDYSSGSAALDPMDLS